MSHLNICILNFRRNPTVFDLSVVRFKLGKDIKFGHIPCQTKKLRESVWMFEKQSPTFDVTLVFMLFRIIYAGRAALTFANNKTSRQYCLEICKKLPSFNSKKSSLMKS